MKNQKYNLFYSSSSLRKPVEARLGTIEKDASALFGLFENEEFRGKKILKKLLTLEFKEVLDIGAGKCKQAEYLRKHGKNVFTCDIGNSINSIDIKNYDYVGDFNKIDFRRKFECTLCSHILEHQLNVNSFLRRVVSVTDNDGYIAIIVPPRKPFIIGGHTSIWNAGLLLYNLILSGIDCSKECYIKQYDYNIGIIVKNVPNNIDKVNISFDDGDINLLSNFFPFDVFEGFNGDILEFNWNSK